MVRKEEKTRPVRKAIFNLNKLEIMEMELNELYKQAKQIVIKSQSCSPRQLQIELKIGYMRANRFVEQMEKEGIVGSYSNSKVREVLIKNTTNDTN